MYIRRLVISKCERFKRRTENQSKKLRERVSINKRGLILLAFSMFFLFWKKDTIEGFISNYLISESNLSNPLTDFLVICLFLIISVHQINLFVKRYKPNFQEFAIVFFFVFAYALFRFEILPRSWDYFSFSFNEIYYLDAMFGATSMFLIVSLTSLIPNIRRNDSKNLVIEDNPIDQKDNKESDVFQRKELVTKIVAIINNDKYKKAVSIGIIGPWGNGKSSLLNQVKEQIKDKSDIIAINLQPFLNHSEVGIIDEFFSSFDHVLSKYSGSLSNYIERYTRQLIRFYKTGGLNKIYEWRSSTSATNLYGKIDKSIKKINKKIVVFVDDLDRLNGTEIIQVLKLIRNTANFHNTVFLVALDKDYAIKALRGEKEYQNHRFLEKFFQLEIFLPEIQKNTLKQEFFKILKESEYIDEEAYNQIVEAVEKDDCYFSYANRNLRDVKKLANQLIFENQFIDLGLDYCDLINFLILKLRYPKAVQLIDEQRKKIFDFDNYYYFLKLSTSNSDGLQASSKTVFPEDENRRKNINSFNTYQVSNSDDRNGQWFRNEMEVSVLENDLLFKLMIGLWGRFQKGPNSIQFFSNFNKVLRLKYDKGDLTGKEYNSIKKIKGIKDWNSRLDSLFERGVGERVLYILNHDQPKNDTELKSVITFLLFSLRKMERYGLSLIQIKGALGKWLNPNYWKGNDKLVNKDLIRYQLLNGFFLSKYHDLLLKIDILQEVWIDRETNDAWGLHREDFSDLGKKYLNEYFSSQESFDKSFWDVFHKLKHLPDLKEELFNSTKEFLSRTSLIEFCKIAINMDGSPHFLKLADFTIEIFGSINKFEDFINAHPESREQEILEVLHFVHLQKIVGKDRPLRFSFKFLELEFYTDSLPSKEIEDHEKITELLFKFKPGFRDSIVDQINRGTPESNFFQRSQPYKDEFNEFLLLSFPKDKTDINVLIKTLCKGASQILGDETEWENVEDTLKKIDGKKIMEEVPLVLKDRDPIVSLISVQPPLNL